MSGNYRSHVCIDQLLFYELILSHMPPSVQASLAGLPDDKARIQQVKRTL